MQQEAKVKPHPGGHARKPRQVSRPRPAVGRALPPADAERAPAVDPRKRRALRLAPLLPAQFYAVDQTQVLSLRNYKIVLLIK